MRRIMLTIAVLCALPGAGVAQQPAPPQPSRFEVASVRRNTSGSGSMSMGRQPGGLFKAVNAPLLNLIRTAFGLPDRDLVGVPAWAASERYDVTARAPGEIDAKAERSMLQALLRERFKLVAHFEKRDMPVYDLVVARGDGRLGPLLRRSTLDCSPEGRANTPSGGAGGAGQGTGPLNRPACGSMTVNSSLIAGGVTVAELASTISRRVDRPVIDRTGLNGFYDVDLTWAPTTITPDDTKPSIFTAVQEQLGLRLERSRGPIEVLVIDSVDRATPD